MLKKIFKKEQKILAIIKELMYYKQAVEKRTSKKTAKKKNLKKVKKVVDKERCIW